MSANAISLIKPYRWEGMWVFDDERVDLFREPFIAGADTLIDVAIEQQGIRGADDGFLLLFSATAFPGADFHLEWLREELEGNVYLWKEGNHEAWLCPALLKYFDEPPQEIYVQVKESR